jgi:hypothetical protein
VIYDEAHQQIRLEQTDQVAAGAGSCRVTWRPELLDVGTVKDTDLVIDVGQAVPSNRREPFRATLNLNGITRQFTVGHRGSEHVRHRRKYAKVRLPPSRRFYFHAQGSTGVKEAATLEEFHHLIGQADLATVAYHASRGDFSRWVGGALADDTLARELAHIERDLNARHAAAVEEARHAIRQAVQERYLES